MQPTIDPMRGHDIEVVARLRIAAFFEGTGRTLEEDAAGIRNLLTSDGLETALVARVNDVPVGTCLLVRHELEPAHDLTPWLAGLVVDACHRGKGTGTALVRAIEAHAASAGVEILYLYTWEARTFYKALGWEAVEVCEQDGEPMMLMSRRLAQSFPKR
ncbi:GNAT family N-acetyltransferase [Mesorhizobium sp. BH1-1-4]|uniref:GNAT family N-acetyltransferase n=1 Tax=Mesorhizobium sp. BH1-1-4 TaxID=2876662 RepID=UPI001CD0BF57|nr:GNAT family N-acetyltransferase [Mesorhizobium sp. BH1-1-4]MBZ9996598.1 GNAT family N-acetyltransferase [Mesorhizobium sp. BH1-1-4]